MIARYASLFWVQVRASLATSMAYRADFLLDGLMSLWWVAQALIQVLVVFSIRGEISGWTEDQALVVVAWFTLLRGVLEGAINPSLLTVSEAIRSGTMDFTLIKPADAQFLVSTARFQPWKLFDVLAAFVIMIVAFTRMGVTPSAADVGLAFVLTISAVMVLYSIWILVVCAAFWVVRLDNLAYLFGSLFDFARWPLGMFGTALRFIFTFIIPLGLLTTFPAEAILGRLELRPALIAFAGALTFAVAARLIWRRAIGHYTSASS